MTPEARAARERKQKVFVAVGGLVLLVLVAIQLPKLLGGSSSPEAVAATTTEASALPAQPATAGGVPVSVVTPTSGSTKLTSFSAFERKDPFIQQVPMTAPLPPADSAKKTEEKASGSAETPTKTFDTGKTEVAAATIVTVNGARQVLEPGMRFPATDPLFVLVAEKPQSKAVVVGIVGGAYAGGAKTTALRIGKSITLVNTATGAKYKLTLVSVGSGDAAESPAATKP